MKTVRTGIIGCGVQAQEVHIPNYLKNSKSKLAALCDMNKDTLTMLQKKYNIEHVFTDYHEFLESGLVDAISICVPTALHAKVAVEAAEHGIHVLCEKPIALTLEEAETMIEAASKNRIKFMVGYNRRFLLNHIKTKEFVQQGRIGIPILARAEAVIFGPYSPEIPESSYSNEASKRVGCLFDSATHLLDLLIWMFSKPIEVCAYVSTHNKNVTVDDTGVMIMKFQNGILGNINVTWANLPDYSVMENDRMVEILGSKGKIESDGLGPSLRIYCADSLSSKIRGKIKITPGNFDPNIPNAALTKSFEHEVDNFLDSVVSDKTPAVTGEQAKDVLEVILAAYKSSLSNSSSRGA